MPRRMSTVKLTKRVVDGLAVERGDEEWWHRRIPMSARGVRTCSHACSHVW